MIKNLSKRFVQVASLAVAFFSIENTVAQSVSNLKWSQAGPVYASGRCRNMVVDKTDASGNSLYVGSATSGLFYSNNAGASWSSVTSPVGIPQNISYIAQLADNSLLIATGEGFLRPGPKSKSIIGTGLYRLSGSTVSVVASASSVGTEINKIAVNPTDASKFAIATNQGVYVTTNGGASMTLITDPAITFSTNSYYGIDVKIDNSGILYAVVGNEKGSVTSPASKIFRSTDNSFSSFTQITPSSPLVFDQNYGRCEVAIAPSDNKVVYISCAGKYSGLPYSSNLAALYVNYDIVNTPTAWQVVLVGSTQNDAFTNGAGSVATGDFAQSLKVDPANANNVFLNGFQSYYFNKTGSSGTGPVGTWTKLGNHLTINFPLYLHENIHDMQIVGSSNSNYKVYYITDAGIYRTVDNFTSFQPFYNGIVTGQYNSVSVERFPLGVGATSATPQYTAYSGFVGGTNGSGINYFSGNYPNVTTEINYIGGDVFSAEYSKILPNSVLFSTSNGALYQTADIQNNDPDVKKLVRQASSQAVVDYANTNYNLTGTQFKMWENYGQLKAKGKATPDSVVFYNDTLRFQASIQTVQTLTTQSTFSFSANRPNRFAKIDSIVVRTATVTIPQTPAQTNVPFTGSDRKDVFITFPNTYTNTPTSYTMPGLTYAGAGTSNSSYVAINDATKTDIISITYTAPPFANKTATSSSVDNASYYRVFATVFYKYQIGDSVSVVDNNISNNTRTYKTILTASNTVSGGLRWKLGSTGYPFILNAPTTPSYVTVNSPSYALVANLGTVQVQASPTFTVRPATPTSYTIQNIGANYTFTALPLTYTVVATTLTGTPSYTLLPNNVVQSTPSFTIAANTVTANTNYTIAVTSGTTVGASTFSTINTATYMLNPGAVTQSTSVFNNQPAGSYTMISMSGNTAATPNRTISFSVPTQSVYTAGYNSPQFFTNNPRVKIATDISARLAYAYGTAGSSNGIYLSKNALNLNDPLSHILISRTGALTCDANGVSTNSTIAITGSVTLLEWSKFGNELYYATSDNKLYRVNNLYTIMDSTSSSYNGKLHTGIFTFSTTIAPPTYTVVGANTPNPRCPYRTTLLGTFTKPIRSISVTNNDSLMALTFDGSSADTLVLFSTNDIRKSNFSNIAFVNKTGNVTPVAPGTKIKTYCSMFEKDNNKQLFIGTEDGLYGTNDITSAAVSWSVAFNNSAPLPRVQIFDVKQQTMQQWESYNSGQIYVATGGRGVWTNRDFAKAYEVGIEENKDLKSLESSVSIFPNPTNGNATILFNSKNGESASVSVSDITGKVVINNNLGKLYQGETAYTIETANLPAGVYIVNIQSSSNVKRVAKLIVAK